VKNRNFTQKSKLFYKKSELLSKIEILTKNQKKIKHGEHIFRENETFGIEIEIPGLPLLGNFGPIFMGCGK